MRWIQASAFLVVLSCPAVAQLVSPVGYDRKPGNLQNLLPFGRPCHWMQIHGDLRGKSLLMKGLSFRRHGGGPRIQTGYTLDLAAWMGESDLTKTTSTFKSNYTGTPTLVVKRRKINTPASTPLGTTFNFKLPFSSNFVHTGKKDFAWEWVVHATGWTSSGFNGDQLRTFAMKLGPYKAIGTGCVAKSQVLPMTAQAYAVTQRGLFNSVRYYCTVSNAPKTATGGLLVGLKNPNLPFPVCGPKALHTDALLNFPIRTDSVGFYSTGFGPLHPWNPAMAGVKIFSQAYVIDTTQRPLPIAVSNGVESTVPDLPSQPPYTSIHSYSPSATKGSVERGLVMITRFDG